MRRAPEGVANHAITLILRYDTTRITPYTAEKVKGPSSQRTPICPGLSVLNTPWWRRPYSHSFGTLRRSGKRKPLP
jgi:hypothetical protein